MDAKKGKSGLQFLNSLRPIISLVILLGSLFTFVFLQMEERRMGYELLSLNRQLKKKIEDRRLKIVYLAKSMRLQKVEETALAQSNKVSELNESQVVHLTKQ